MERLIDAEKLNFHCNYNGDCSGDVSHCKECDNYVLDYRDIQEQPTSYDTDKVVAQLEELGQKMSESKSIQKHGKSSPANHRYYKAVSVKRAIEIVKGGGVNE